MNRKEMDTRIKQMCDVLLVLGEVSPVPPDVAFHLALAHDEILQAIRDLIPEKMYKASETVY